jgi:hypothetical protein
LYREQHIPLLLVLVVMEVFIVVPQALKVEHHQL